tara:strand:+ start:2742 stop:2915 length:174 start_codon:yes stop_codon:yes gene_type:complete
MPNYRVANPNNIPKGVPLIQWQDHTWYEGDTFVPPEGLKLDRLLRDGHIVEVKGGKV